MLVSDAYAQHNLQFCIYLSRKIFYYHYVLFIRTYLLLWITKLGWVKLSFFNAEKQAWLVVPLNHYKTAIAN